MGLFDFWIKRSNPENPETSLSNPAAWMMGAPTGAGVVVDEESSITLSAVYACVRIISETIASLPLNVYQRDGSSKHIARDHPLQHLLHYEPNDFMTSFVFRETMQAYVTLWGNAYARIKRNGGARPTALIPIHPSKVKPLIKKSALWYEVTTKAGPMLIPAVDMLHIPGLGFDGLQGKSPIQVARENIGLGLASQGFGADFFKNNASFSGVLESPNTLKPEARKNITESWKNRHSGQGNRFLTPLLEGGIKFNPIGIPPEQAQWIASRKFQLTEVARIFRVPPHMMADLERSTNNNIEHQGMEFVTHTLRPWAVKWEQEQDRKLFRESEKLSHYSKFNMDALLRGDAKTRAMFLRTHFHMGTMNRNEIRALEDQNPIEGGDTYYIPMNLTPDTEPTPPNNG